mmetsp:Transcript_12027/g.30273  ORF Transcript_12027/g.30273 Transcript_12027/m.30273 type:complete len:404 (+) Transcript_12027:171-1382(+)
MWPGASTDAIAERLKGQGLSARTLGGGGQTATQAFAPRFLTGPQLHGVTGVFGPLPTPQMLMPAMPQMGVGQFAMYPHFMHASAHAVGPAMHSMPQYLTTGPPMHSMPQYLTTGLTPVSELYSHMSPGGTQRWDEPVKCQVCPRVFATKYQAKKHFLRRHFMGEKRFFCSRCNKKSFAVREDLTMHFKACMRMFVCSCGLQLRSQATLKRHCKHTAHEPTSWEGVPVPPTAAELARVSELASSSHAMRASADDDGASSTDNESLATPSGTPIHGTPLTTPESTPYSSPAMNRRFGASGNKQPLLAVAARAAAANGDVHMAMLSSPYFASREEIGPLPVSAELEGGGSFLRGPSCPSCSPCAPSPFPMPGPYPMQPAAAPANHRTHAVEEMTADELLDMLSACL